MQIEGGGYWPLLTLRGACATAAAEIRLKASGMNPDTLRVNKTMFFYKAIEAVSDEDTLATDAMARIAGGIGCFGELYASVGIHGFKLASARNTPLNQATPLDMASLLGRLMRYKDHLFREHPDIYETQGLSGAEFGEQRLAYYRLHLSLRRGRRTACAERFCFGGRPSLGYLYGRSGCIRRNADEESGRTDAGCQG